MRVLYQDDFERPQNDPEPAILFVTQVPVPADFATIGSVFANHLTSPQDVARGGDLWIRYADGFLRNLTREAGFGLEGFQGASAIAVRDPEVHWSGSRALFSMLVGAPAHRYEVTQYYWQIYEVEGLGRGDTPVVTRLPNQPPAANNVSPVYDSGGRVLFVSDRSRNGAAHLYPQLDEYESTPTPTGLWSLDPSSGDLFLLQHSPSGSFDPIIDSFGRVIFTRWDHLQRDQQADADSEGDSYGSFDYLGESASAARVARREETFPEPRSSRLDLLLGTPWTGHSLNHFFPWQLSQDGTGEETLNHLGRHELHEYFDRARSDDPALSEFIAGVVRPGTKSIENFLQIREDPTTPGRYIGVDAPEFGAHAAGQIVALLAPPQLNADDIEVTALTLEASRYPAPSAVAGHPGHFRDPLPLADGGLIAAHTFEAREAGNEGSRQAPVPRYRFRLRRLIENQSTGFFAAGAELTTGITEALTWWDPDEEVHYSGELWELQPVEVRARPVPPITSFALAAPESSVLDELGIAPADLRAWMSERDLGLLVVRNATSRDDADRQQPFNLRVPGGVQTKDLAGEVYEISGLELYQADQVRGYGGRANPDPGRRVIAMPMSAANALAANAPVVGGEAHVVEIGEDGSIAAFVPARRALAWQLVSPVGAPVVRERYWITVQPGEIRACDGCHGVNKQNQAGEAAAGNSPEALRRLLGEWAKTVVVSHAASATAHP